jgi:hypothetical protein
MAYRCHKIFFRKSKLNLKTPLAYRCHWPVMLSCHTIMKPHPKTFSAVYITKRCAEILPNWIFFTKHVQIPRYEISGCVQSL